MLSVGIDFSRALASTTPSDVYTCTNEDGQGVYHTVVDTHTDASCNVVPTNTPCLVNQYCEWGQPQCIYPTPKGSLIVQPNLIQMDGKVQISWNITGAMSCSVLGTNGDGAAPNVWNNMSDTKTSSPITQQTIYTLTCTYFDPLISSNYVESETVSIAPQYHER